MMYIVRSVELKDAGEIIRLSGFNLMQLSLIVFALLLILVTTVSVNVKLHKHIMFTKYI